MNPHSHSVPLKHTIHNTLALCVCVCSYSHAYSYILYIVCFSMCMRVVRHVYNMHILM